MVHASCNQINLQKKHLTAEDRRWADLFQEGFMGDATPCVSLWKALQTNPSLPRLMVRC